ncbi:MAG: beta-carotene 15,15'-dioxygenase, Brp/Blh family [Flavobacterium sp.]|jgi:beta-carotene 15,15'-dioxygenase|nr:beta-carotene 15,15'-dioxygenase, Brp/Blh family [Flavobacterium sp.]
MIFFTFLLFWVSIQFGQIIEDSIAYVIVLSIGIIHGSNDFTILKKQKKNTIDLIKSTSFYLFLILLCIACYLMNSFVAILFFVILSSYHFGEQHLENKFTGSKYVKSIIYVVYGMLIFSLIFIENFKDVEVIMRNLTGEIIPNSWIETMLVSSSLLLIILIAYQFTRKIKPKIQIVRELFYVLLLYLVFKSSSLILGFAIYFVLWHSIPSILDQTKFLSGGYTFKTMLEYLKTAFVYWLISITGLVIAYYYFSESLFNSMIFIVLFAVTAPHVWVMNRMKQ